MLVRLKPCSVSPKDRDTAGHAEQGWAAKAMEGRYMSNVKIISSVLDEVFEERTRQEALKATGEGNFPNTYLQAEVKIAQGPAVKLRTPVYMMHPLGGAADRERNRKLACLWQAEIQRAHPEWVVLAPWIGLSGAWGEDLRELGMEVDFATIDLCVAGVIAGPTDGPVSAFEVLPVGHNIKVPGKGFHGVSPGMAEELQYFWSHHPERSIFDLREQFKVELPADWLPPRIARGSSDFKPRFQRFEEVYVENKQGGTCHVKDIEETAPGVYRYLVKRTETFFAHEQALAKKT